MIEKQLTIQDLQEWLATAEAIGVPDDCPIEFMDSDSSEPLTLHHLTIERYGHMRTIIGLRKPTKTEEPTS